MLNLGKTMNHALTGSVAVKQLKSHKKASGRRLLSTTRAIEVRRYWILFQRFGIQSAFEVLEPPFVLTHISWVRYAIVTCLPHSTGQLVHDFHAHVCHSKYVGWIWIHCWTCRVTNRRDAVCRLCRYSATLDIPYTSQCYLYRFCNKSGIKCLWNNKFYFCCTFIRDYFDDVT